MNIVDPSEYAHKARECSRTALQYASESNQRIVGLAHVLAGRARALEESPSTEDRRQAEHHRDVAQNILRKFPGGSLQRNFETLQARLNSGSKAASTLRGWIETGSGVPFDELEICITRRAWVATGTMAEFKKALDLTHHKAEGLLKRAGVDPRHIYKMAKRVDGKSRLAVGKQKQHHAG
jgi:hypothetical protein